MRKGLSNLINNETTTGISLEQIGVLLANNYLLRLYSNAVQVNSPLFYIHQDNGASSQGCGTIINDGTGIGIILQNTNASSGSYCLQLLSARKNVPGLYFDTSIGSKGFPDNLQCTYRAGGYAPITDDTAQQVLGDSLNHRGIVFFRIQDDGQIHNASGIFAFSCTAGGIHATVISEAEVTITVDYATGVPTGTTGVDGNLTFFASSQRLDVENRTGSNKSVYMWFMDLA